jgi:hypothetical protein
MRPPLVIDEPNLLLKVAWGWLVQLQEPLAATESRMIEAYSVGSFEPPLSA